MLLMRSAYTWTLLRGKRMPAIVSSGDLGRYLQGLASELVRHTGGQRYHVALVVGMGRETVANSLEGSQR
jgi:hypothetical protein